MLRVTESLLIMIIPVIIIISSFSRIWWIVLSELIPN